MRSMVMDQHCHIAKTIIAHIRHRWRIVGIVLLLISVGVVWWNLRHQPIPADPRLIDTLEVAERTDTIAVNADASLVAIGDRNGHIILWQPGRTADVVRWQGHTDAVTALVFSADDQLLLSGGADGVVTAWNVARREQQYSLPALTFQSAQAPEVAEPIVVLVTHADKPIAVAGGFFGAIVIFNPNDSTVQHRMRQMGNPQVTTASIESLALSDDGDTLAIGRSLLSVQIWNMAQGHPEGSLTDAKSVLSSRFTDNDRQLLIIERRGDTQRWLVKEARLLTEQSPQADDYVSPRISPDGSLIARGGRTYSASFLRGFPIIGRFPDPEIQLVAFDDFAPVAVLAGHEGGIYRLAFNQTGTFLVSSGWSDNTVRLWDLTGIAVP